MAMMKAMQPEDYHLLARITTPQVLRENSNLNILDDEDYNLTNMPINLVSDAVETYCHKCRQDEWPSA